MPKRIQRRRVLGWRMPKNTIYIGRGSRWGNPFIVGIHGDATTCIAKYSKHINPYKHDGGTMDDCNVSIANIACIQRDLRGKDLACWCKEDDPCHGDLLLKIANEWSVIDG